MQARLPSLSTSFYNDLIPSSSQKRLEETEDMYAQSEPNEPIKLALEQSAGL